jgi:hypothetical protein
MTAITIELQDELAERLAAEARRRNVTLSELLARSAERLLSEPENEIERIVEEILLDNAELYRRLA